MVTANRFWSQIFGVAFSNKRWLHFFIFSLSRLLRLSYQTPVNGDDDDDDDNILPSTTSC
jgi:hypothetical protein